VFVGRVASDATAYRTLSQVRGDRLEAVRAARAAARRRAWVEAGAPARVMLDIDATLVASDSEKELATGTYTHGFGFHPLVCFEAETGEALAGCLRPGNAGANTASDHIAVLCLALQQLPRDAYDHGMLVRCDSGGATHAFLDVVAELGVSFSVGFDLVEPVREAILSVPEGAWQPAIGANGDERDGASVVELTSQLPSLLASWPASSRLICRRERPHPGAQLSFSDSNGDRFQVFLTNQQGRRIARLEQLHRARAAVEDAIRCAKDTGLRNMPFRSFADNQAWLELVLVACDLLAWTRRLLLATTSLARAEPKRLRYRRFHVAGRVTRHARRLRLELPRTWPWTLDLLAAFAHFDARPPR
jgi:Transposase DDE domain group 1